MRIVEALVFIFILRLVSNIISIRQCNVSPATETSAYLRSNSSKLPLPFDADRYFSFVHVSKCAGASLIKDFKGLFPKFFPSRLAGYEASLVFQRRDTIEKFDLQRKEPPIMISSTKSPRHHVFSLFMECRYSDWGVKVTSPLFPRNDTDQVDFDKWLSFFVDNDTNNNNINNTRLRPRGKAEIKTDLGRCYQPPNVQSRYLVEDSTLMTQMLNHGAEPNITLALEQYASLDFVVISEFFRESQCLLYFRVVAGTTDQAKAAPFQEFVEQRCRCPVPEFLVDEETHVTHHNGTRRKVLRDLPATILTKIEALTRVDVQLYRTALLQFMNEIHWLETQLERRVVCDSRLTSLEEELLYLGLNITELYHKGPSLI